MSTWLPARTPRLGSTNRRSESGSRRTGTGSPSRLHASISSSIALSTMNAEGSLVLTAISTVPWNEAASRSGWSTRSYREGTVVRGRRYGSRVSADSSRAFTPRSVPQRPFAVGRTFQHSRACSLPKRDHDQRPSDGGAGSVRCGRHRECTGRRDRPRFRSVPRGPRPDQGSHGPGRHRPRRRLVSGARFGGRDERWIRCQHGLRSRQFRRVGGVPRQGDRRRTRPGVRPRPTRRRRAVSAG